MILTWCVPCHKNPSSDVVNTRISGDSSANFFSFNYVQISAVKNVTAKSEFPVASPILQTLPVTGQIF